MSRLSDLVNQVHASSDADEQLRLVDEGLNEALAWNETEYITLFAKLGAGVSEGVGTLERAVRYLELIPVHVGNDAVTHLDLGRLWFKLGDRENGLKHFKWCHEWALKKRGQKGVLKLLKQELRRHELALADLAL